MRRFRAGIAPEEEEIDNYVWRLGEWRRRGRSSSAATVSDDQDEQEEQGFRLDLIYKTTCRCKGVLGVKEPYAWQLNAVQQLVTKKKDTMKMSSTYWRRQSCCHFRFWTCLPRRHSTHGVDDIAERLPAEPACYEGERKSFHAVKVKEESSNRTR